VPGYDLTFSAPKSVSLLHALGAPAVQSEVLAAHEQAVAAALGYLERGRLPHGHLERTMIPDAATRAEDALLGATRPEHAPPLT
jgi:conjugative relaxase-like TrwC/TraI family protein